jgi:hypothetical protein
MLNTRTALVSISLFAVLRSPLFRHLTHRCPVWLLQRSADFK